MKRPYISAELLTSFCAPQFSDSYFFSFEGIEGSGKSTQIIRLKKYLEEEKHFRVLLLREPGGTAFGEKLRQVILESKQEIHPLAEAYLFASSRTQLLTEVIMKELAIPHTIVISDRYIDSSIAYQGHANNLGVATVLNIHQHFPLNVVPHLTFYLRISADTSEERQRKRNNSKDYFEAKGFEFYKKLIEGYDYAHELFPKRVMSINAENPLEEVSTTLFNLVDHFLASSH